MWRSQKHKFGEKDLASRSTDPIDEPSFHRRPIDSVHRSQISFKFSLSLKVIDVPNWWTVNIFTARWRGFVYPRLLLIRPDSAENIKSHPFQVPSLFPLSFKFPSLTVSSHHSSIFHSQSKLHISQNHPHQIPHISNTPLNSLFFHFQKVGDLVPMHRQLFQSSHRKEQRITRLYTSKKATSISLNFELLFIVKYKNLGVGLDFRIELIYFGWFKLRNYSHGDDRQWLCSKFNDLKWCVQSLPDSFYLGFHVLMNWVR